MKKRLTNTELFMENIVGVKIVQEKRSYSQTIGSDRIKTINRTKYLKLCWFCGSPYESYKYNSFACSKRCSLNLVRQRKLGLNPPIDVLELKKPKNVKDLKERLEYK